MKNKLFLSPHNDDEALYGCYTILREKPLVVVCTDSYRQIERGITREERIEETKRAMEILGVEVTFLGIPDNQITDSCLSTLPDDVIVYAPYPEEGGNPDHNKIGELARKKFKNVIWYSTYTKDRPYPEGEPIKPTREEYFLKMKALSCYKSQLGMSNKYYFDQMAVRNECLITHTKS